MQCAQDNPYNNNHEAELVTFGTTCPSRSGRTTTLCGTSQNMETWTAYEYTQNGCGCQIYSCTTGKADRPDKNGLCVVVAILQEGQQTRWQTGAKENYFMDLKRYPFYTTYL